MTKRTYGVRPGSGAARSIEVVSLRRDYPFQRRAAGGLQQSCPAAVEMLEVMNFSAVLPESSAQCLFQLSFAINERLVEQIIAIEEKEVERKEDQTFGLSVRKGSLQSRKVWRTGLVKRDDLAVDDAGCERRRSYRNFWKLA